MKSRKAIIGRWVDLISLSGLCVILAAVPATGQALPAEKVATVTQALGGMGRYMEQDIAGGCKPATLAHWPGFPLKKCTYRQAERGGKTKTATVIMLNPSKEILAKWIVATCMVVIGIPATGNDTSFNACLAALRKQIISQSGAQFPVAGIVLEDMITPGCGTCGSNGIQEAYTFRDGVTVKVSGGMEVGSEKPVGASEIRVSLDPDASIERARLRARIQSTTREEYKNYAGARAKPVEGVNWVNVIRELYQETWTRSHSSEPESVSKYRNDLMIARCYSMLGKRPPTVF